MYAVVLFSKVQLIVLSIFSSLTYILASIFVPWFIFSVAKVTKMKDKLFLVFWKWLICLKIISESISSEIIVVWVIFSLIVSFSVSISVFIGLPSSVLIVISISSSGLLILL